MHSCPWTGRIWCSSGCSFSSPPSTQPPQSSSRALPSSPPAAPCCSPSCQPREQPGLGGCRPRKAFAMHVGAVCAVFALADGAKCRVRPCHKVAIFTKDIKLYMQALFPSLVSCSMLGCSSLLLFSAFGSISFVGSGLRQIRPGAGFLLLGF